MTTTHGHGVTDETLGETLVRP
eukprot:gene27191-biopygen17733